MAAAGEPATRFAHLLQPIRDLSKVWKIEIADELEKYIDEVAQLILTNPEDGVTQLNFAEAALLIQGSTAIYSRKVELLYQLVYQALDMLALDKAKDATSKKGKCVQTGLWAPIPETDELLTIDHLIKQGRNITLDQTAPEHRQALQRRVPLFLMPRDQADVRRKEFRISSCTVHHSGVYLLQESDCKLLDEVLASDATMQEGCLVGPLVPAPPSEVQDLDDRLQQLLRELPQDEPAKEDIAGSPSPEKDKKTPEKEKDKEENEQKTPAKQQEQQPAKADGPKPALPPAEDPWALLDEHELMGNDVPLEVGKTSKRLNAKKMGMTLEQLSQLDDLEAMSDAALWDTDATTSGAAPFLAAGNPIESLFLSVAGNLKSGGKYETQRAGFSAVWLEFEDLFVAAMAKRRSLAQARKAEKAAGAPMTPVRRVEDISDDDMSDTEGKKPGAVMAAPAVVDCMTPQKLDKDAMTPNAALAAYPPEMSEEMVRIEEQRKEVAMLENMIQDAQSKYESTIRQHLLTMQKDAGGDLDNKRYPQLYSNVRRWQDQLEPVLKEFESRPDFNIHTYNNKFLTKLSDFYKDGDTDKTIPFRRLVHGQPRWEVCRRFLTCLILTNSGNTDILYETEEERLNKFHLKLLNSKKEWISLEEEASAAGQGDAPPAAGSKRQRKAKA